MITLNLTPVSCPAAWKVSSPIEVSITQPIRVPVTWNYFQINSVRNKINIEKLDP